jgi:hypothetical protein
MEVYGIGSTAPIAQDANYRDAAWKIWPHSISGQCSTPIDRRRYADPLLQFLARKNCCEYSALNVTIS